MINKNLNSASSLKLLRFLFSLVFFMSLFSPAFGQEENFEEDPIVPKHKYFEDHNPAKAMWMSAALPGLGQYYNQKYWKIPIVYAGFSTLAYVSIINKQGYEKYRDAYASKLALDGELADDPLIDNYSSDQLLRYREFYQGNLELNYILFGAFYVLQIIDAAVDAHFYQYNINDNLSLEFDPIIYQNQSQIYAAPGLQLRWKLGNP
jgi:hypothetical protein